MKKEIKVEIRGRSIVMVDNNTKLGLIVFRDLDDVKELITNLSNVVSEFEVKFPKPSIGPNSKCRNRRAALNSYDEPAYCGLTPGHSGWHMQVHPWEEIWLNVDNA